MKLCLTAINSKYIHTSPAVDSLRAYSSSQRGIHPEVRSFTVNQPAGQILGELYRLKADAYFFSVYIWNCELVYRLSRELSQILPEAELWYGGPEVSFRSRELLEQHPELRGIMRGEGEETFTELAEKMYGGDGPAPEALKDICGISYRIRISEPDGDRDSGETLQHREAGSTSKDEGKESCEVIRETPDRPPMNLDGLVFPYWNTEPDPNRIYYYESSRGCPFRCSYCLSSVDKALRFKSLEKTEEELAWFLENKVKQVKFVDRTFNLSPDRDAASLTRDVASLTRERPSHAKSSKTRALKIWRFLKAHDNGVTNFHFEICGELLTEEELEFLGTLRPGQVQFEIGVQTVNPETLKAICRQRYEEKLKENVSRLLAGKNIHIHLDLIAGLPFEDLKSFRHSFNEVYGMQPLQLQLGFLKVLKGTPMESFAAANHFSYQAMPPFEVLGTPWLSYEDLLELKGVEEMVEVYYNSRQFEQTIMEVQTELQKGTDPGSYVIDEITATGEIRNTEPERTAIKTPAQEKKKIPEDMYGFYRQFSLFYRANGYDRMDHSRMDRCRILLEFLISLGLDQEKYIPLLLSDALARERIKHWPEWAGKREKPAVYDYDRRDPLTGNAFPVETQPGKHKESDGVPAEGLK